MMFLALVLLASATATAALPWQPVTVEAPTCATVEGVILGI
jgi:hypothetical protein